MNKIFALAIGLLIPCLAQAHNTSKVLVSLNDTRIPPHLPLDMTGEEYTQILRREVHLNGSEKLLVQDPADSELSQVLNVGKRNIDWLKQINAHRPTNSPALSFSSPENMPAYPIHSPRVYNPQIIVSQYQDLLQKLPRAFKDVLLGDQDLPFQPALTVNEHLTWGLQIDSLYQLAARWNTLKPFLSGLAHFRYRDIRGYLLLSQMPDRDRVLRSVSTLSEEKKQEISNAILQMCENRSYNATSFTSDCQRTLQRALKQGDLSGLYSQYESQSRTVYQSFFEISPSNVRQDVSWSPQTPQKMTVPFRDVSIPEIQNFLTHNIQDEWRWNDWNLVLDFQPNAAINVTFAAGATPHVDAVGGNNITMDANTPLDEYWAQWAIRHEFGHNLGFPDCYLEFYDTEQAALVSYQIDTSDLMCSRRGHFKERHFLELKKGYFERSLN